MKQYNGWINIYMWYVNFICSDSRCRHAQLIASHCQVRRYLSSHALKESHVVTPTPLVQLFLGLTNSYGFKSLKKFSALPSILMWPKGIHTFGSCFSSGITIVWIWILIPKSATFVFFFYFFFFFFLRDFRL